MRERSGVEQRRILVRSLIALLLAIAVLACGQPPDSPAQTPPDTQPGDPVVAKARADLAAELGAAEDDITVITAEPVTWSDGSLGCPEPGKMYTQALVDGYRVVLEYEGVEYHYHAGEDREPFHCPRVGLERRAGSSIPSTTLPSR